MQPHKTVYTMRTHTLLLASTLLTLPLLAAPTTVEERLQKLEDEVQSLRKENESLRTRVGDGKTPFALVTAAGKESKLALGGYLHLNAESGNAPDARYTGVTDRFLVRRARLGVSGSFKEDISFKFEGDFGANTIGASSGYRAQITDVFVTWTKYPEANVRFGQFKTPFGYEQLLADTKTIFAERSLANDRLTASRQIGAMVTGEVVDKKITYSVGAYNGNGVNNSVNDNEKFLLAGRVAGTVYTGKQGEHTVKVTTGANYFTTEDKGTFVGQKDGYGVDAQLAFGPADVMVEWLRNDLDPVTGADTRAQGWSALAAYRINPKWQAAVRFETYEANTLSSADTTTDTWTMGVNYFIKGDDLKLTLNYLLGDQPIIGNEGRLIGRLQLVF